MNNEFAKKIDQKIEKDKERVYDKNTIISILNTVYKFSEFNNTHEFLFIKFLNNINNQQIPEYLIDKIYKYNNANKSIINYYNLDKFNKSYSTYLSNKDIQIYSANIKNTITPFREQLNTKNVFKINKSNTIIPKFKKEKKFVNKLVSIDKTFATIKYFFIYNYNNKFTKRLFKFDSYTNSLKCTNTNENKKNILSSIVNNLDKLKKLYENETPANILNNIEYVNKNTIQDFKDYDYLSLLHNIIFNIENNNIDIFYKIISEFINNKIKSLTDTESINILKNINIKFYTDPTHYIISIYHFYKNDFITFINKNNFKEYKLIEIIDKMYENAKKINKELYDIYINYLNTKEINNNAIKNKLIKYIEELKKYNINFEPLMSNIKFNTKDIILFINNIKLCLTYFINLSDKEFKNINDVLQKNYKFISKQYDTIEFYDLIKKMNLNIYSYFNIDKFDLDLFEIVFTHIEKELLYKLQNIYSNNTELTLLLFKYKLLHHIVYCIDYLNKTSTYTISNKNRYYFNGYRNEASDFKIIKKNQLISNIYQKDSIDIEEDTKKQFIEIYKLTIRTNIEKLIEYNEIIYLYDKNYDTVNFIDSETDVYGTMEEIGTFDEDLTLGEFDE